MQPGDIYTVDFHLDLPELYPASFSFSPAIADGTARLAITCAIGSTTPIALQMSRTEGEVYGYIHLPCRVEVNARLAMSGEARWLSSRASG